VNHIGYSFVSQDPKGRYTMSDSRKAFEKIERHFTSGNSVDVERATILKSDWELAKQYMIPSVQDAGEPVGEVSPLIYGSWDDNGGNFKNVILVDRSLPLGTKVYTHPPRALVPQGYKLVSIKPTLDMIYAAHEDGCIDHYDAEITWEIMVAAAQEPSKQEPTQ
jgi:hypothetical protein